MAKPQGPSSGVVSGGGAELRTGSSSERKTATDEARQAATDEAREIGQQARAVADDVKHEAREAVEHAKEHARSVAATQKDAAAHQIDGFAHALQTASDDLRNRGQNTAAEYIRQAADGLERASGTMRERDVDDLIGTVEDFARRQPVAFLGGAVAAGFGLARLVKSSADRRRGAEAGTRFGEGEPA